MNNRISSRQIFFFLACVAPVGKIVFLPSHLALISKNDLLFPVLAQILLQAAVVFCVLLLAKRQMSFYELLENTFGKIVAKILMTVYALFLLFAALLPILEQKQFVQSVCYDTLPTVAAFAPFFVFSAYLCSKPLGSYGRTWDILGPLAIVGYVGVILLSCGAADYAALAPAGGAGAKGFLDGTAFSFCWFFDAALLLPLLGRIEYKKGMAWKGALFYLAGGGAILFFLATFYGIFQSISINQLFAFSATSKYFSGVSQLGRVDYIFIFTLALVMAFYVCLPLQGSVDCVLQAYGRKRCLPTVLGAIVSAVFFALTLLLDYRFGDVLDVIADTLFWIFAVFALLVPAAMLLLRRDRRAA